MAISMRNQHQRAIDKVKGSLDQTNPINKVITKVDDPTEDSEMLIYWLDKNNIPCMLQKIYLPVDVSEIEHMKVDKKIKQEAIDYKSEKASEKIVWISRSAYAERSGLGTKLKNFLNDNFNKQLLIINDKSASINPNEKTVGFIEHQKCGLIEFKNPNEKTVGFDLTVNVKLNGNDSTYFPSTLLPEIFKKYDHKSDVNKALSEYYKATRDFTKKVLDIIETNFFIYMCEVQYERSQCTINKLLEKQDKTIEKIDSNHREIMGRLTRKHDRVITNDKDPRVIAIYRHNTWPKDHIKVFGGLKTDRRYKDIVKDDSYIIVNETQNVNNTAKIKKDIIQLYKLQKHTLVDDRKRRSTTLKMSKTILQKFIGDLQNIDIDYLNSIADSSDSTESLINIKWLVISRDKIKTDGHYGLYIALSNTKYINQDDDCLYVQKQVYNDDIIDDIRNDLSLEGEYMVDEDDGLNWFHSTIKSKKDFTLIVDYK